MSRKTGKEISKGLVWLMLIFVLLGLGGYGVKNFGGRVESIGTVGDQKISTADYARALQRELNAQRAATGQPITMAEAQASGLVTQVRSRVIADAALDNEAARIGVSVGDDEVAKQVMGINAFQGPDGTFSRETYRAVLQQNGMTEAEFEAGIRRDAARSLLQAAVVSGIPLPDTYSEALFNFIAERRSASLIRLTAEDLPEAVPAPDEEQIKAQYEAHPDAYTAPQTRKITYAWLTPEMMLDRIEPDEETLRNLYQQRIDEFVQPERRLVERLVFPTEEAAQKTMDAIRSGETTFEKAVEARGLALSDVDLGDVTEADIGGEAGKAVFAPAEPTLVGPVTSDLGPAIFRVNAILAAQETSFEDARAELADEAAHDRAVRMIADKISGLDDKLAAGATLEDLAQESDMELGQIDFTDDSDSGIAAYASFRKAAGEVSEGDFPEIRELEDGGIFALRLDEEVPPELRPLDKVRDEAAADWRAAETIRRLSAIANDLKGRLDSGEAIDALGVEVTTETALPRGGLTPPALSEALFAMKETGETAIVPADPDVWLVRLDAVLAPDETDPNADRLRQTIGAQAGQGIAQDLYGYFAQALINSAGLSLDQAAINAVQSQFR